MSTNMVKKVLVEQAELDRLHQRQLQDYSPELHSLARLQTQMTKVLWRQKPFGRSKARPTPKLTN